MATIVRRLFHSDSLPFSFYSLESGYFLSPFLWIVGLSVLVSVAVTVMIMCLRDSNRRAVEEAEKEEAELMEEMGNSDDEDL